MAPLILNRRRFLGDLGLATAAVGAGIGVPVTVVLAKPTALSPEVRLNRIVAELKAIIEEHLAPEDHRWVASIMAARGEEPYLRIEAFHPETIPHPLSFPSDPRTMEVEEITRLHDSALRLIGEGSAFAA